jgi:hypothetical protein
MDATFTRVSDAVAGDCISAARPTEPTRNGVVLEITRFDSFAPQPTAMAMICTGSYGGAVA